VNARRILAALSISFGKSPVVGQNASVPNLFSATELTLPPMLSDSFTPFSMATLPHAEPLAFILPFHPGEASGVSGRLVGAEADVRFGGGGGAIDMVPGRRRSPGGKLMKRRDVKRRDVKR
jgi:hypothetical protein